ncbi:VCBS domain-containing protein [Bacteroides fluxus]|uniref:VCBS domain-containing protein n=1 Tax=Bacteroides fluxus TaxID=626930 RepID=UPI0023573764|nr:VCBS domain-containing protein [Bacteroides fluxus]
MKFFAIEQFGKEEMSMLKGGADVTASKTIQNADGTTTVIKTTIKDDGTVIIDRVTV